MNDAIKTHSSPLALTLALAALAGCGEVQQLNYNNGAAGNLTFEALEGDLPRQEPFSTDLAVKVPTQIEVRREESGPFECRPGLSLGYLGGPGSGGGCIYKGEVLTVTAILDARCDDGRCRARVVDAGHVEVIADVAGPAVLRVKARLSNGIEVDDSMRFDFAIVDFTVYCNLGCPGGQAVFVGERFEIAVTASVGGSTILREVEISDVVSRVAVKPIGGDADGAFSAFEVTPRYPGVATLQLRVGEHVATRVLRIASADEVVSGHLFFEAAGTKWDAAWTEPELNLAGDEVADTLPFAHRSDLKRLLIGWKLKDGSPSGATLAFGGTHSLSSNLPAVRLADYPFSIAVLAADIPDGESLKIRGTAGDGSVVLEKTLVPSYAQ